MGIRILKGGMHSTVQDLGRLGFQSQGFGVSGVMDQRSYRLANLLLDNPEDEAVLEISRIGPTIAFTSATIIAITGGDFFPKINGIAAAMYTAIYVEKGDILAFGGARSGSYGYIAFSSCLDLPQVMGSRSTNTKCALGGFKGRALTAGDYIRFRAKRRYLSDFLSRHIAANDFSGEELRLRVIMGPQEQCFTEAGVRSFLHESYTVSDECDRMGCRLEGAPIGYQESTDIISDGIVFGSVQVPAHGKPIVLMADRQTTGGYAKIATVISVDIPKLAQCRPGQTLRFAAVSVHEAQQVYRDEMQELAQLREQIHSPCKEVLECRLVAKRLSGLFGASRK